MVFIKLLRYRLLLLLVLLFPLMVAGAASTDFESFAVGTSANAVAVPGMSFATTATTSPWQIYGGYANPPYAEGKILGTFGGDTLTIQFNPPQGSMTFGYGGPLDSVVRLYRDGALISTQTLPGPGLGNYTSGTLSAAGGFDRLEIVAVDDFVLDNISTAGGGVGGCANDSRLNNYDCAAPVVVYCGADGGVDVYTVEGGQGTLAIRIGRSEIEQAGIPTDHNIPLASHDWVTVYRLTTGEFQVNAYPQDGPGYVFVWDACPASRVYTLPN